MRERSVRLHGVNDFVANVVTPHVYVRLRCLNYVYVRLRCPSCLC